MQNEKERSPEMMKREQSFTKNQGHKMEIKGVRNIYYLAIQWRRKTARMRPEYQEDEKVNRGKRRRRRRRRRRRIEKYGERGGRGKCWN